MAFPTINYNASTGSDTAASGSNAPSTALTSTGTGITISTAASTTQTFSAAVDLTGVLDDDSDAIWINTTGGTRHLFRITSFTGGVAACTAIVTTETAGTTQSGLSWAIGGKRLTIQADTSRRDFVDLGAGWTANMEAGTYDTGAAIVMSAGDYTSGPIRVVSTAGAILNTTANSTFFTPASQQHFIGLEFACSNATKTSSYGFNDTTANLSGLLVKGCKFGSTLAFGMKMNSQCDVIDCEFAVAQGANNAVLVNSRTSLRLIGCYFHDLTGIAVSLTASTSYSSVVIDSCIFDTISSTYDAIKQTASEAGSYVHVRNSVFYSIGGDAFDIAAVAVGHRWHVTNCIFVNCGAYAINNPTTGDMFMHEDYNAFYNNTSGNRKTGLTAGANDVTLTGDPFTNAAGGDFSLNSTAGAGAACKDVGFPQTVKGSATDANMDIGVAQGAASAAAGGLIRHPGMDGGLV